MRVLLVRHNEAPKIVNIPHTLSEMQRLVGGDIEIAEPFDDDVVLVCGENGRNDGMPLNCIINSNLDIFGNFFLCECRETELEDLPEEKIFRYASMFRLPRNRNISAAEEAKRPLHQILS